MSIFVVEVQYNVWMNLSYLHILTFLLLLLLLLLPDGCLKLSYLASPTVGFAQEFERRLQLRLERHWLRLGDALLLHGPPGLVHLPPALPRPGLHQVGVAPAGLRPLLGLTVRLGCLVLLLDPHRHNHLSRASVGQVGRQDWKDLFV